MSEKPDYLETHRFRLTRENSRILHKEISTFEELQKKYPGIQGIAFFGSKTKGIVRSYSDLDMIMFYDGNLIKDPNKLVSPQLAEAEQAFIDAASPTKIELSNVDISNEATDRDLGDFEKTADLRAKFNLVSRFFLGIGEGLYANRKYLLDKLEASETGEVTFQRLMVELRDNDRRLRSDQSGDEVEFLEPGYPNAAPADPPYKGRYPSSIQEARRYFISDRELWKPILQEQP